MCVWLAMIDERTFPSRSTTAAAVSSHDDSIPRIKSLLIQIPKHFRFSNDANAFDHRWINSTIHQCRSSGAQSAAINREIRGAVELRQDIFDVVRRFRAVCVGTGYEQRTGFTQ